jgi:hypothetical protein
VNDGPNPYQPPKARVEIMAPPRELPPPPTTVIVALVLLWATLAIDVLDSFGMLIDAPRIAGAPAWDLPARVIVTSVPIALFGWFIWKIATGRRWARVACLILTSCSLSWFLMEVTGGFGDATTPTVGRIAEHALPAIAMVLLFTPSANAWFRSRVAEDGA